MSERLPAAKIGILGDLHAEDALLERALDQLARAGAELVLCVGDLADGKGDLDRSCALLRERRVVAVGGNHDRWMLGGRLRGLPDVHHRHALAPETVELFEGLPAERRFASPFGEALLCHGLGDDDMASVGEDDDGYALESNLALQRLLADRRTRLVFNGHTHRPLVRRVAHLTIVNAGTLHRDQDPGYVLVDLELAEVSWHGLGAHEGALRSLGSLR